MQTDPIERPHARDPRLDHCHQLKRWLLLELVSSPPAAGDDIDDLASTLKEQRSYIESAVDDLIADGLAERHGDRVRASTAAWRFDALWPAGA
jgi:predicted transcriptional regulator